MAKDKKKIDKTLSFIEAADMLHDSVLITGKNNEILFANKTALKLFGFTQKSIHEKDISVLLPGFNKDIKRKLEKNKWLEFEGKAKNNTVRFLEISSSILKHNSKTFNLFILRDITKLKRISSERDMLKSKTSEYSSRLENILMDAEVLLVTSGVREKKYRDLIEYFPVAIARIDASTDNYEFVNAEFRRQSGYSMEEFNSLPKNEIFEMVHPDDRDDLYKKFKDWADNGYKGLMNHTYRLHNRYNELLWLDAYFYGDFGSGGELSAVNQVYVDITGIMEEHGGLQRLGDAIESTTEMITITDLNNNFIYVNRAFQEKYGYLLNDIKGKKAAVLGSVKNKPDIHDVILNETAKGGFEGELINTKKNGSEFPVLLSTSPIINSKGNITGYIGVARDITDIKNAYDRLKHSLVEKEILLKEVYHRVKNNMQVISSLLNIQSQSVNDSAAIELLKETQNRVRIMQLIHEKLYKSRDLSKIDFSLYIRDLVSQLRRAYPVSKNVEVKINSEGIFLGVNTAIPCGLIINELVSNAYKYAFNDTDKKGEIYIELSTPEDEKYILIVCDNGSGIPKEFDIANTDSLGMVLVTTLTKQLGGSIEIEREKGTKFTIRF